MWWRAGPAGALWAWQRTPRFVRNAVVSIPTFLLDLGLLYVLVRRAHVDYLVATAVSFLIANTLNYFLARWLVFVGTRRSVQTGLVYFLAVAVLSAVAMTPLMWVCVSVCHIEVIASRIITAAIVGVGGYVLNLTLTFGVARSPARARTGAPRPSA